jgi:hypothetical protein
LDERAGGDIAHDDLQRDDLDFLDQLLAHVDAPDEVCRNADPVEMREDVFGDAIVEHALAVDNIVLLLVEGGGVVLEELDQRAGLWAFIKDLGLAFVDTAATGHGASLSVEPAEAAATRHRVDFEPCFSGLSRLSQRCCRQCPPNCTAWDEFTLHFRRSFVLWTKPPYRDYRFTAGSQLMSSMKDRENAFENKFAHDEELKFKAEARRNKLLGLWAAELLGKSGDEAETYAKSVVMADFEEAGDEDVFRKVRADFDAAGVDQSDHQLRRKMNELLAVAVEQIQNS